jgi:muramoyltetrapeptide carboxypeptidase LdcA involved in peptidoglycan recycling
MAEFVTPPPASPGDAVAVIAPSSAAANARNVLELGIDRLQTVFDLRTRVHPTARQSDAYLRDHPETRAAAIHEAFRDPDIGAVFAAIGGDDQLRVLSHLDPGVLRANPTRFFGMSDNTNLALYLYNRGVVSFYGGQLLNQVATPGYLHPYTETYLRRALFEESLGTWRPAEEWADLTTGWERGYADADPGYQPAPGWSWAGGDREDTGTRVRGRIWGGCLAILEWQLMTGRYLPDPGDLDGAVLLLETSEDCPPTKRVKWALMCMGERGLLERFDAVLVGRPATQNWQERRTEEERAAYREAQRDAIVGQLRRYNPDAPVVFDLDVGHTNPTTPVPIGGEVTVDPRAERVRFS